MVAVQKNFELFKYVDDDGGNWNKRGEVDTNRNSVDGSAAAGAYPVWRDGTGARGYRSRKIVYQDPTTFRTVTVQFYTAAAYAAIVLQTDTMNIYVPGEAVAVTYTAIRKIPEHKPGVGASRMLADHA